ncbi:MAG: DNA/RNA non-specific endonuclease [Lentisphaeria bacterium]|nr:DNA/RNA non-specific endonuclease [Lentisphaeria bacterium]
MEQFNNRESFNFSKLQDYRRSGYDRRHLALAADMAFSGQTMVDSFFMSNMSPQRAAFNRGIWKLRMF